MLVLADERARTEVFLNEAWVKYIEEHHWGLLVMGVKVVGTQPSSTTAAALLEQSLFSWIESKTSPPANSDNATGESELEKKKGAIPLLFHASGSAAFWMESIMLNRPARFAAWLAIDPVKFPEIPRIKNFKTAPGGFLPLVAPYSLTAQAAARPVLKKFYDQLEHFEEIRSRNEENCISFLPWSTGAPVDLVDSFARMYLDAAVHSEDEDRLWLNVHTLLEHPLNDAGKPEPTRFGCLPNQAMMGAVKALRPAVLPSAPPAERRSFFKTEEFASCELRWIRTVPKPKAVLVVAANLLPSYLRYSSDWIDYASKHEWAVLLMGLKEGRIPSLETAASNLETQLYQEIEALAGPELKGLPLITYAQGNASTWLQTLMLRQPSRYQAWISLGAQRFPSITTTVKVPPGLIISQNAGQFGQGLLHFEDLRNADSYNPVCFLPLADVKPSVSVLEAAYRVFLDAAVSARKDTIHWLHLHNLKPPPPAITSGPEPKQYGWFPRTDFLGIWKLLRQDTVPAALPLIAKRSFKTKVAEVPELKLFVRIPGGLAKGQAPNGVLCFCTWQQEDTSLINRLKSTEDSLVAFADRQGMAVITWNTASMLPEGTNLLNLPPEIETDMQAKYSVFGEEWRSALKKVCNEFKLHDKGMLLYGISRGAAFAHQISMRYPQLFLAVHTHIGSHYNETVPKEAKDTFWLVTTGEADGGYRDSLGLYTKFKEISAPTLFKAGESLGHASRRDIEELGVAFFTCVIDLRNRCEKEKEKDRTFKDTPVSLFQKAVANAPWYGDYINHQVFKADNAELISIPVEQRLSLPTEDIAKAWGMSLDEATAKKVPARNFAAGK